LVPDLTIRITASAMCHMDNSIVRLTDWLQIIGTLLLICLTIHLFHIEMSIRLHAIMPAIVFGFGLYAWLSTSWRLPYLFGVNLVAIMALMGWRDGGLLLGFGMTLFGIANLPVALRYRVALLLAAAFFLSLLRADWIPLPDGR
jgi:hypothetical protein